MRTMLSRVLKRLWVAVDAQKLYAAIRRELATADRSQDAGSA